VSIPIEPGSLINLSIDDAAVIIDGKSGKLIMKDLTFFPPNERELKR